MTEKKFVSLVNDLYVLLASTYGLYLKTQCYHWNVKGNNFAQLHKLFEGHYNELSEAVDVIAEQIIMMGCSVRASFEDFSKFSKISQATENFSDLEMINDLLLDHRKIQKILNSIIDNAEKERHHVLVGVLADRLAAHQKCCWFLESLSSS